MDKFEEGDFVTIRLPVSVHGVSIKPFRLPNHPKFGVGDTDFDITPDMIVKHEKKLAACQMWVSRDVKRHIIFVDHKSVVYDYQEKHQSTWSRSVVSPTQFQMYCGTLKSS